MPCRLPSGPSSSDEFKLAPLTSLTLVRSATLSCCRVTVPFAALVLPGAYRQDVAVPIRSIEHQEIAHAQSA